MVKLRIAFGFLIYTAFLLTSLQTAVYAAVDLSQLVQASGINATLSGSTFNRRTGQETLTATLTNSGSAAVSGPFYYVIESLSSANVTVVNNDDVSQAGNPVYIKTVASLAPGASVALTLVFNNPNRLRFTFSSKVFIQPPPDTTPPVIDITSPINGAQLTQSPVTVTGSVSDASAVTVDVNGVAATVTGGNYSASVPLVLGANTLTATATDAAGNTASATVQVTLMPPADTTPPVIDITSPIDGAQLHQNPVIVTGTVTDASAVTVDVNGVAAIVAGGNYSASVTLNEGSNTITAVATDSAGNTNSVSVTVNAHIPPIIKILNPTNFSFVNVSPIIFSGDVDDATATVTVNGISASLNGQNWSATVPLHEGYNTITAVATKSNGSAGTASLQVTLDTTPPQVTVDSPADGFKTTQDLITVTGIVNDIVVGTVNSGQATVTVNGVGAQVANRTYVATGIPLQLGPNNIQVIGTDQTGNSATTNITVTREAITQPFVKVVSGDNQSGNIGTALAAPLVVQILNGATPVPNVHVIFKVTENDGFLTSGNNTRQLIAVDTDAQGQAQAVLTLGNRAGAGNNVVEAYAAGYQGTAVFIASGTPKSATKINVDSGTNQFGAVGQALPLPFVAVVTDDGHNRLGGVDVTFTVTQGGGNINGASTYNTVTDSDGRVLALLTLGPAPGQDNNVVEATFTGGTGFAAAFAASAKVPGDPAQTSISGVVQDNSNNPIENVTMRVFQTRLGSNNNQPVEIGTPVPTDANGQFKITAAPLGFLKLMADGTTATAGGKLFPTLEFEMVTVAGQDNTVGMPIYLPALDPNAKLCVTATTGGVLTMPSSPGFALTLAPGAATFPGGSKTGCVTVTPVNPDKVPMVPGFGQQPRYVVTIQPVGTSFNPPAAITIPNMDGLAPNAKTEMYSYDHDLASFVAIGSGTVSADGSVIASDPGTGVMKAGWHCGGNPNTTGSAGTCADCQRCQGSSCVADAGKNDSCCGGGSSICKTGTCSPVKLDSADGKVNGKEEDVVEFKTIGTPVNFTGTATGSNCDYEYKWDFGDGQTSSDQSPAHTYINPAEYNAKLTVKCKKCSPGEKSDTVKVYVAKVELDVTSATLTLLKENKLEAKVTPASAPVQEYKFEIRRASEATWYELQKGATKSYAKKAKVSGKFKLRVNVKFSNSLEIKSDEKDQEVQFPNAAEILGGAGVSARMDTAWSDTKNATTATTRREEGYYITVDTSAETYGITAHSLGATVNNNQGAGWDTATFPRPADSIANPTPLDQPTYTVAWFHTHTPTVNRAVGRPIGPSGADFGWSSNASINVPGYAYDYVESPAGSGNIPAGHPINSSAMVYTITPPDRRPTP